MSYVDRTLTCVDCGVEFIHTAADQEFYAQKGFVSDPKRCTSCRASRRSMRETSGTTTAARQKVADRAQLFSTTSDVCAVATVVTGALALYLTLRNPSGSASSRSAITFGPLSMSGHF